MKLLISSGDLPEYSTYDSLPQETYNGDQALVTADELQQTYRFVGTVDGYPVNRWIPQMYASRIDGFLKDLSGNPCLYNGTNGETKATLSARGWVDSSTVAGTVSDDTDGGDNVLDFDTSTGGTARFDFSYTTLAKEFFAIYKVKPVSVVTIDRNNGAVVSFQGGNRDIRMTWTRTGSLNKVGWCKTSSTEGGEGQISQSSFDPIFGIYEVDTKAKYHQVRCPIIAQGSGVLHTALATVGGATKIRVLCGAQAGNNFQLKELMIFNLT